MVSGIVTALLLGCFLAGTAWAFSPRRRREFDAAARLPLDEAPGDPESGVGAVVRAENRS